MRDDVIPILQAHGVMAVATIRPDGWPQATIVNYVSDDVLLYFLISRSSQKFENITADDRISIAIGAGERDPHRIKALSIAARAAEVRDEPYRSEFCRRLAERHPGYFDPDALDFAAAALMRAHPELIAISDYSQGLGHASLVSVGAAETVEMEPARPDNWGPGPAPAPH